jgi:release factor glutamine methyltransferase
MPAPETVGTALGWGAERIRSSTESPALDVQMALAAILGCGRSWLLGHPEVTLPARQQDAFRRSIERLASGEPLAYLLGWREFYGLRFEVSPAVLIPRPETELLVEQALEIAATRRGPLRLADIGTGSGCIAISLALNLDHPAIIASDISYAALHQARRNARSLRAEGIIRWIQTDGLSSFGAGTLDLLVANPPYVPSQRLEQLPVAHWEPRLALDGGEDGMSVLRGLLLDLDRVLVDDGLALIEVDSELAGAAQAMASRSTRRGPGRLLRDLSGRERMLLLESKGIAR